MASSCLVYILDQLILPFFSAFVPHTPMQTHDAFFSSDRRPRVAVIGAGPSGLVAAKYLLSDGQMDVIVLEQGPQIGGTFVNKVYDNTRLVSSKYLTAFSDHRMPSEYPNHPTAEQYVEYLKSYCHRFQLWQHIRFRCKVLRISDRVAKNKNGSEWGNETTNDDDDHDADTNGYTIQYQDLNRSENPEPLQQDFDLVAVCSGLHNIPNIPSIPNQFCFRGRILHSSSYQDPSLFHLQRVLVCGSGETAMDIAYRAVQHPSCVSVALHVRRGFLSIPHVLPGDRPLDVFITNWLEHSHEHPWVHRWRLRWWLSTVVIRGFLWLTGSSLGFNQWACATEPIRRGYHIINKSHAAIAHLNVPIKRKYGLWGRFWMRFYNEQDLKPIESFHKTEISALEKNTVQFQDGRSFDADVIILATGYRQSFPFLDENIQKEYEIQEQQRNQAKQQPNRFGLEEDPLPSEHFIVSKTRPRLGFIGFVRPNVGAIPPMSEIQVMWWLANLRGQVKRCNSSWATSSLPSYMVLGHKYPYGVDYGNYIHRVAEDMDAAPTLSMLAASSQPLKALYTYCQGQAYIGLFRLRGPYASKMCWESLGGELWDVCMDRGWLENCGLAVITLLSLWMNLLACFIECLVGLVTLRRPEFFTRYG